MLPSQPFPLNPRAPLVATPRPPRNRGLIHKRTREIPCATAVLKSGWDASEAARGSVDGSFQRPILWNRATHQRCWETILLMGT